MTTKQDQLADVLDEYAAHLELDGQAGRAKGYERAARKIRMARYLPPDPSEIDGIGDSIRTTIAQYQVSGKIDELEELREEYQWFEPLRQVDHIGPARAKTLHEKFSVETIDDLLLVGDDMTLMSGVGPKTVEKICSSAREVRQRRED
jgi:DNA polymerase/3'-5' exonuclease PolX